MSLEQWSLLYFAVSAIYYFAVFFSLFTALNLIKIFLTVLAFMAQLGVTLAYGISTDQIGLVFLAGTQVLVIILMFTQYGRVTNEDNNA
jgi:hypothetical protein